MMNTLNRSSKIGQTGSTQPYNPSSLRNPRLTARCGWPGVLAFPSGLLTTPVGLPSRQACGGFLIPSSTPNRLYPHRQSIRQPAKMREAGEGRIVRVRVDRERIGAMDAIVNSGRGVPGRDCRCQRNEYQAKRGEG